MEEDVAVHKGEVGRMKQKTFLFSGEYDMSFQEYAGPMHGPHRSYAFVLKGEESCRKLKVDPILFQLECELCTVHK